eukprot:1148775-Pelagomonas_calceolata.AAC.7
MEALHVFSSCIFSTHTHEHLSPRLCHSPAANVLAQARDSVAHGWTRKPHPLEDGGGEGLPWLRRRRRRRQAEAPQHLHHPRVARQGDAASGQGGQGGYAGEGCPACIRGCAQGTGHAWPLQLPGAPASPSCLCWPPGHARCRKGWQPGLCVCWQQPQGPGPQAPLQCWSCGRSSCCCCCSCACSSHQGQREEGACCACPPLPTKPCLSLTSPSAAAPAAQPPVRVLPGPPGAMQLLLAAGPPTGAAASLPWPVPLQGLPGPPVPKNEQRTAMA